MIRKNELLKNPETGIFHSPVGPIGLGANTGGLGFCVFLDGLRPLPASFRTGPGKNASIHITLALEFLDRYFSGAPVDIGESIAKGLVFDFDGFTDREKEVYRTLLGIPWGKTISYRDLAARSGCPNGARFAGNTMAKNRFPVLVPCHRVIRSDGTLGRYSSGEHIKKKLLEMEERFF
ncbi:MAG TPA: methylated-DNA--[protein]-cysteine S-methyltransferase [Spirochaetota bacterium]|nr:methylated-DNA--[protein]-cysteine S-methyltransferase [Spirochaetota bacterium]HRZ28021.1 methylated-DNA--[protein]-cysteine S-methyltransferase [Spirochaetota bacterium]HSA15478.1 methylated-DNA--[protein]-cysteine S-methyltransferase [Spirochaetota bacterium]